MKYDSVLGRMDDGSGNTRENLNQSRQAYQELSQKYQALLNPAIPSYVNPYSQINPRYTGQQQPQSPGSYTNSVNQQGASFAPMQMYQQFKQTGQAPQGDGSIMSKPTGGK